MRGCDTSDRLDERFPGIIDIIGLFAKRNSTRAREKERYASKLTLLYIYTFQTVRISVVLPRHHGASVYRSRSNSPLPLAYITSTVLYMLWSYAPAAAAVCCRAADHATCKVLYAYAARSLCNSSLILLQPFFFPGPFFFFYSVLHNASFFLRLFSLYFLFFVLTVLFKAYTLAFVYIQINASLPLVIVAPPSLSLFLSFFLSRG